MHWKLSCFFSGQYPRHWGTFSHNSRPKNEVRYRWVLHTNQTKEYIFSYLYACSFSDLTQLFTRSECSPARLAPWSARSPTSTSSLSTWSSGETTKKIVRPQKKYDCQKNSNTKKIGRLQKFEKIFLFSPRHDLMVAKAHECSPS